jgi:hypothetical protein
MRLKTIVVAGLAYAWWRNSNRKRELAQDRARQDERLDEALDESFPASDPPSITPIKAAPVRDLR